MVVSWEVCSFDDIPPKGYARDEKRWIGRTRGKHQRPWSNALDWFCSERYHTARAEYDYDEFTGDSVQSCLDSAIRANKRFAGLRTIRRGDDVYVTRAPRQDKLDYDEIRGLLCSLGEGETYNLDTTGMTLDMVQRLYRAMHNMRSREELSLEISRPRGEAVIRIRSRIDD